MVGDFKCYTNGSKQKEQRVRAERCQWLVRGLGLHWGRVQGKEVWGKAGLVGARNRRQARVKGLGLRGAGGGPEQLDSVTDGWVVARGSATGVAVCQAGRVGRGRTTWPRIRRS